MDTAANTGAGQPIAHASVDLDMRQWKDSQTYQAQVPLASEEVRSHLTYPEVKSSMCSCKVRHWQPAPSAPNSAFKLIFSSAGLLSLYQLMQVKHPAFVAWPIVYCQGACNETKQQGRGVCTPDPVYDMHTCKPCRARRGARWC